MSNDSLKDAIRDDPDRFMIDMNLQKIFNKMTFEKEVDKAINNARGRYRKQANKWTEESDYLFSQPKIREMIITNTERSLVFTGKHHRKTGRQIRIRGHDNGDGTYTIVRRKRISKRKEIRYLQTRRKGR